MRPIFVHSFLLFIDIYIYKINTNFIAYLDICKEKVGHLDTTLILYYELSNNQDLLLNLYCNLASYELSNNQDLLLNLYCNLASYELSYNQDLLLNLYCNLASYELSYNQDLLLNLYCNLASYELSNNQDLLLNLYCNLAIVFSSWYFWLSSSFLNPSFSSVTLATSYL